MKGAERGGGIDGGMGKRNGRTGRVKGDGGEEEGMEAETKWSEGKWMDG